MSVEDINQINEAIRKSSLSEDVKNEVINVFCINYRDLEKRINKECYKSPEIRTPKLSIYILQTYLVDIFERYKVSEAQGRDTHRLIYQALGGREKLKYETIRDPNL
ncbi:hypothetical protein J4229_01105 [Candidatus Pacearchaeota archaeon]|nr:hypothetical protein [Candidatus Pacearchaeota archaeon]